jgi:hypothetical protein
MSRKYSPQVTVIQGEREETALKNDVRTTSFLALLHSKKKFGAIFLVS